MTVDDNLFICHSYSSFGKPFITKIDLNNNKEIIYAVAEQKGQILSISKNKTNNNIMFLSGYLIINGISKGFVLKSIDKGENWQQIYESGNFNAVNSLSSSSTNAEFILIGTDKGVFKSINDGINWEKIYDGKCQAVCFTARDQIFAAISDNIILSDDYGESWVIINEYKPLLTYRDGLKIDDLNNTLFIGTSEGLLALDLN